MKTKGDHDKLRSLFSKIYTEEIMQERIEEIQVNPTDEIDKSKENDDGYHATFCSPKYQTASLVGCVISMLQQLTGINFIMFYAANLFATTISSMSPYQIVSLV